MGFVKDVFNGITGKTAAKSAEKAGQMQSDSAKYAADLQNQQYAQTRQDQMPWMHAGKQALGGLQALVNNNNPQYNDIWGGQLNSAMPTMTKASDMTRFGDSMGNVMQQNYNAGAYTHDFKGADLTQDPSYQWRKQQGMDDIQAQAAASGGLLSGATLKALNAYNSNLASQEYQGAWNRNMAEQQNRFSVDNNLRNQDYTIFSGEQNRLNTTQRNDQQNIWSILNGMRTQDYNIFANERSRQYNELANLAGVGQTTANNLATLGANNAANMGEMAMAGANAQANGLTTGAYAKTQGMNNLLGLGAKAFGLF